MEADKLIRGRDKQALSNFDIDIRTDDGRYYSLTIRCEEGETGAPLKQVIPTDATFAETLRYLRDLVAEPEDIDDIGQRLGDLIFSPEVIRLYRASRPLWA